MQTLSAIANTLSIAFGQSGKDALRIRASSPLPPVRTPNMRLRTLQHKLRNRPVNNETT